MRYQSGTGALFVTDVGATGGATPIGTFQATANGTGYSNGDIIVTLSDGTWRNATTGATITSPNPADLGTFGGAVDFEIIIWQATAANAGLGYAAGDYLYEVFNTTTGGSSWYRNAGALASAPPVNEREIPGGSAATSTPNATPYQIDGTGAVLYGTLSADRTQIESIPPGTTTTIGTGTGQAQITGSESSGTTSSAPIKAYQVNDTGPILYGEFDNAANTITPAGGGAAINVGTGATDAVLLADTDVEGGKYFTATAPDRAPDYVAGNELRRLFARTAEGYQIRWLNVDTGVVFDTAPVSPTPQTSGGVLDIDPVRYRLNDGTINLGWIDQDTGVLYEDVNRVTAVTVGTGPTEAILSSINDPQPVHTNSVTTSTLTSAALETTIQTLTEPTVLSIRIIVSGWPAGNTSASIARILTAPESAPTAAQLTELDADQFFLFTGNGSKSMRFDDAGLEAEGSIQIAFDQLPAGASANVTITAREAV